MNKIKLILFLGILLELGIGAVEFELYQVIVDNVCLRIIE